MSLGQEVHHQLLLADPGREYHVLDLVAAETGRGAQVDSGQAAYLPRSALGDAGEILDARAKDAYRRRLAEYVSRLLSRPSRPCRLGILTSSDSGRDWASAGQRQAELAPPPGERQAARSKARR
jgi:hypothetical protein